MNCTQLQELAAAEALMALPPVEAAKLRARLSLDPDAASEAASFQAVAALLAIANAPAILPPSGLKEKILRQLELVSVQPSIVSNDDSNPTTEVPPGFRVVTADSSRWNSTPIPGFRYKRLSVNRNAGYQVLLAELDPGAFLPEHDHDGPEQTYVLTGHLESEGKTLGPGDLLHAEPGTHHRRLYSPDGCTALIIQKVPVAAQS